MYKHFFKRILDFTLSLLALIILSPLIVVLTIVGLIAMKGNPFFTQQRPGLHEKIFYLIKYRTMDNRTDDDGTLLPDEVRLNKYGRFLRATSLEGNNIIGQTTESLVNKGFREVSPIYFFTGRDLFSKRTDIFDIEGGMNLLALNQGQETFRAT